MNNSTNPIGQPYFRPGDPWAIGAQAEVHQHSTGSDSRPLAERLETEQERKKSKDTMADDMNAV